MTGLQIIRDKKSGKRRGYGFVSFKDPADFMKALKEMNGKYIGNRPCKLKKSTWKQRDAKTVKTKIRQKEKGAHLGGNVSIYSSSKPMKFS